MKLLVFVQNIEYGRHARGTQGQSPAEGQERVLYAGLPEQEREAEYAVKGIPLAKPVYDGLARLGSKFKLELETKGVALA